MDEGYLDYGYPHTNLSPPLAELILDVFKPKFWLEVGSMIGGFAICVADVVKTERMQTEIVCIDPFCGDVNLFKLVDNVLLCDGHWMLVK